MSEETNPTTTTATTPTVEEPKEQLQVIDKGAYQLEQVRFRKDTALEGTEYYVLQLKNTTEDDATKALEILTKKSEDGGLGWSPQQVVGIINTAVRSAQRTKAQNEILSFDKEEIPVKLRERLAKNPVLLSPEDAEKWKPGERELTIQGMMRQVAKLIAEGNAPEAMKLMAELNRKVAEQLQTEVQ